MRHRVMVVEDSPTQAWSLRTLFEGGGLDVIAAASAEAALDLLQTSRPDAIVLDYHLPGMNGDAFCRQIKQNVNTRAIPVLMLTVERSDAAQMRGLESGADDYLPKNADQDVLLMRVRSLLRRSEGAQEIADLNTRFSRARVLAVDDSPTYLHFITNELKAERYEVEQAQSGQQAVELVSSHNFDCVLVDFEMPGMDGAEVCKRIAKTRRDPDAAVVLVMLTSQEDKEHLTRALEAGADDYITKSSDIAVVKARLRALLRRKFFIQENRRILVELRDKELRAERARAEKEAAELRATMADQLAAANQELEKANRKLEEALKVTRAITSNAADALLMVDANERVSFVNPAAETLFGFGHEELLGQTLAGKLIPAGVDGKQMEGHDDPLTRCLETARTIKGVDAVFLARNGTRLNIACSYAPIVHDGRVTAAVLVLHDVSERMRAEERLREAQKLESIGLLAGGIAHDFNNLLTGILGNASLAQEMLPQESGPAAILKDVVTAGERAADLTRQMLAYSGKGRFHVEMVDLSALSLEISKLLLASIAKTVTLKMELADELPPVEADAGQMQQVIMNLVINAAESMGDQRGAVVTVRTCEQWVDERFRAEKLDNTEIANGRYVRMEVSDTGCGMDETTRSRIFDPFFSTKFAGRGLGLAAVAGIVRSHRGAIRVTTELGKGSTFLVLFPAKAATATRPSPAPQAAVVQEEAQGSILVIDDEESVRRMASYALTRNGHRVRQASSGREGIEILQEEKGAISLVLLDLTMPGLSGIETMQELRKFAPDVEVVISSGYGEEQAMSLFSGQRVSGFIQKPYTAARLMERVRSTLRANGARRRADAD
jgi:PAS domain S-box-containing protein